MNIDRLKKLAGSPDTKLNESEDYDYSMADADSIAQTMYDEFIDNYSGLMSKRVAFKAVSGFVKRMKATDEFDD